MEHFYNAIRNKTLPNLECDIPSKDISKIKMGGRGNEIQLPSGIKNARRIQHSQTCTPRNDQTGALGKGKVIPDTHLDLHKGQKNSGNDKIYAGGSLIFLFQNFIPRYNCF